MATLLLPACSQQEQDEPAPTAAPTASAPTSAVPEDWYGRWNGPEGTYLEIRPLDAGYTLVISDLDGPKTYAARSVEGGLRFERNGVEETVRATDGAGTGMKWLADKNRCLAVKAGEGFCRD